MEMVVVGTTKVERVLDSELKQHISNITYSSNSPATEKKRRIIKILHLINVLSVLVQKKKET